MMVENVTRCAPDAGIKDHKSVVLQRNLGLICRHSGF